jgi:hypothetical protein
VLDVVERSYLRTTWLDKRADLLQQYADHLSGQDADCRECHSDVGAAGLIPMERRANEKRQPLSG